MVLFWFVDCIVDSVQVQFVIIQYYQVCSDLGVIFVIRVSGEVQVVYDYVGMDFVMVYFVFGGYGCQVEIDVGCLEVEIVQDEF